MSEQPSFFEKLGTWIRNSITFKIVSIAILILLLLIPTGMINDLIRERQSRQESVVSEISSSWGNEQTLTGPVLTIPYITYYKTDDDEELKSLRNNAYFLPNTLNIDGDVNPELRYRGIFEAVVYSTLLNVSGEFIQPDFSDWNIDDKDILWNEATISVGIPDMRGINDNILLNWEETKSEFKPGVPSRDVIEKGISTRVNLLDSTDKYAFNFNINLNGSSSLNFTPLGAETIVSLKSSWKNPSFSGQFLPDEREINEDGFTAKWKVLQLNRDFPQQWRGSSYKTYSSVFGVDLMVGVDQYQKNMRTSKYAVLIIALTFLLFFFMEVINKKRIHPIQYLLVGFALCIFYALLLSISEQSSFGLAYIVSSVAVITLVLIYIQGVLKSKRLTLFMGGAMAMIYGFIFIILQLQDFALLVGSVGLFAVLAVIMYYTRHIDWYDINKVK